MAKTDYQSRALGDMDVSVFSIDSDGMLFYGNEAARKIFGITSYLNRPFGDFFTSNTVPENDAFFDLILAAARDRSVRHSGRYPYTSADGVHHYFYVTSSRIESEDHNEYLVITCKDITAETEAEELRKKSVFILFSCIIYICLFLFVYAVWDFMKRPIRKSGLTMILEFGGMLLGILIFRFTTISLQDFGLSARNLKQNLKESGIACAGILAVFMILKAVTMRVAPNLIRHPEAFFALGWVTPVRFVKYIFTALIQEFLTRSIMQECLMNILTGKHRNGLAIIISTLMFASLHLMYGPIYMIGAGVLLGIFGLIYLRHRSIWGLALIHFTFGMGAMLLGLV